ncbi:hypothetical protein LOK49_LG10G00193 [Camellia lanceoleosa]|uniref:Uncharacterized protein n=1 Tax=Camellia lanceoleosa TaxID=1840588 RepID=A0ACC0GCB6_9ERIC|nr:hypothetical protein LOK49_LG10G00193 [Camellia lanceoleosa]
MTPPTQRSSLGKRVGFVKFNVDVVDKATGKKVPGIVFARGPAVAVLILLESDGKTYAVLTEQVLCFCLYIVEAMVGHDDSGSYVKKSIGVANDVPTFNAENMQNNMKAVYYSRTFMCIIGGVVAGILGFTGLTGFIFYFLVMAITSIGLIAKTGFSIHSYFDSWNQIIFDGILGRLMSFVLFWIFAYDFVHIF